MKKTIAERFAASQRSLQKLAQAVIDDYDRSGMLDDLKGRPRKEIIELLDEYVGDYLAHGPEAEFFNNRDIRQAALLVGRLRRLL